MSVPTTWPKNTTKQINETNRHGSEHYKAIDLIRPYLLSATDMSEADFALLQSHLKDPHPLKQCELEHQKAQIIREETTNQKVPEHESSSANSMFPSRNHMESKQKIIDDSLSSNHPGI